MHLDFQKEENVCTKTCDRIDPVIIIVFKAVTKLPREKQPLICFTIPPSPHHPLILLLPPPTPHPLVSFSLHLFNDNGKNLVYSRLQAR